MLDLEQRASVLCAGHPHLSHGENTCPWPACLGGVGFAEKTVLSGRLWAAATAVTQHRWHVTTWETALEKGSCHFCSSGLAGAAAHLVGGAGCQRTLIIMETEPFAHSV